MENPQPFVGIDVSSQRLDVDTVPVSQPFSEPNNEDGIASLTAHLKALNPQIVLLEAAETLLSGMDERLQESALAKLRKLGVDVHLQSGVADADNLGVTLTNSERINAWPTWPRSASRSWRPRVSPTGSRRLRRP